jgi:hypothetical protein
VRIPHPRIILAAALVVAGFIGAAYAWTYWPPASGTKSQIERTLVGYELAPAPIWPAKYYGLTKLTPRAAADVRAGYVRNLRRYATGHVLAFLLRRDFPKSLTDNRGWGLGRFEVAGSGRVVYYDFRGRRPNGDLVVRAAVQHTFTVGRWDVRARSLHADSPNSLPEAVIFDYTLHRTSGRWKVATAIGWRFLDVPSGRVTYDPPASAAQQQP